MKRKYSVLLTCLLLLIVFAGCKNETVPEQSSQPDSSIEMQSKEESSELSEPSSEPDPPPPPEPKKATEEDLKKIRDYDSKYFVKKLNDENKYHFVELYTAVESFQNTVEFFTPMEEDDFTTLMFLLNYDCPELIQLNGDFFPQYSPENLVTGVGLSYCMKEDEIAEAQEQLDHYCKILREKTDGKDQYDIEKTVYDMIFYDCQYCENDPINGSIYGTLIKRQGRCEGFSKSFAWCMRKLGFECLAILGAQEWNVSAAYINHSWNILRINDQYYHVDLTVDNLKYDSSPGTNPANYGFLNVPDEMIMHQRSIDKYFVKLGVPECKSTDLNYHIMNDLYIKKGEILKDRINMLLERALTEQGISDLSIKFEELSDYNEAAGFINDFARDFLNSHMASDIGFYVYYNELTRTLIIDTYTV